MRPLRHVDSLAVTEAAPILAYVLSMTRLDRAPERAIRAKAEGAIARDDAYQIRKVAGFFPAPA